MNNRRASYYIPIASSFVAWEVLKHLPIGISTTNLDKLLHGIVGYSLSASLSENYKPSKLLLFVSSIAIGWEIFEKIATSYGIPITTNVTFIESLKDIISTIGGYSVWYLSKYFYSRR